MNETKLKKLVIGLRCFVSLEIPAEAKQKIGELSAKAKALGLHATFTSPEEWHVTLAFLGEITESKAAETAAKLRGALQGMKPLALKLKGAGFFPSEQRINVFWTGVQGSGLNELRQAIAKAVGVQGKEKNFTAHVTICRVKGRENLALLRALQKEYAEKELAEFTADKVALKKSTLTPNRPVHEEIACFKLS